MRGWALAHRPLLWVLWAPLAPQMWSLEGLVSELHLAGHSRDVLDLEPCVPCCFLVPGLPCLCVSKDARTYCTYRLVVDVGLPRWPLTSRGLDVLAGVVAPRWPPPSHITFLREKK